MQGAFHESFPHSGGVRGAGGAGLRAQIPNLNLTPDADQSKTPEEKEAQEARTRPTRNRLRKIPDAKASTDPWGNVRSDAPKTAAPAKPKTKTGSAQTKMETR